MARNIVYHMSEAYNLGYDDGYKDGYEEGRMVGCLESKEKFLDAYCKTCCNLERKKCLELDGMCKQYAKLIKNLEG